MVGDAFNVFDGIVDPLGTVSYADDDLVFDFSGFGSDKGLLRDPLGQPRRRLRLGPCGVGDRRGRRQLRQQLDARNVADRTGVFRTRRRLDPLSGRRFRVATQFGKRGPLR
jgi:hypothetical protein